MNPDLYVFGVQNRSHPRHQRETSTVACIETLHKKQHYFFELSFLHPFSSLLFSKTFIKTEISIRRFIELRRHGTFGFSRKLNVRNAYNARLPPQLKCRPD